MATPTTRAATRGAWTVVALIAAGMALVLLGYLAGAKSPFGAQQSRTETGVASLANDVNGLALFDSEDGEQVSFHADEIWWSDGSSHGQGDPPCLRDPGQEAAVDVGVMWVQAPDGVSYKRASWVRCH